MIEHMFETVDGIVESLEDFLEHLDPESVERDCSVELYEKGRKVVLRGPDAGQPQGGRFGCLA